MIRILLAFALCCLAGISPAASAPGKAPRSKPVPAPDGERFLFIVETSSAMGRIQAETEAALFELIGSGVYRQMRPGDTYGLWTFNKETLAGEFPMQIWDSRNSSQLGTIAAAYLSDRKFEKSSDMKRMISTLTTVIHSVSNLNILIISNGDSPLSGTPLDKAVNAAYKAQRRERIKARKPFVTSLVARDGWIIDSAVVISGTPIKLPERPVTALAEKKPKPTPVPKPVATPSPTNSVVPQIATAPKAAPAPLETPAAAATAVENTAPVVPPPVAVPTPKPRVVQIITKTNAAEKTATAAVAAPTQTELITAATSAPTNAPVQAASPPEPTPAADATLVAATIAATAEPPHEPVPSESVLVGLLPKPLVVAARELPAEGEDAKSHTPGTVQAAALPATNGLQSGIMLAFGAALLAAAVFLLFVVFRRYRSMPQGSLITQSMDHR